MKYFLVLFSLVLSINAFAQRGERCQFNERDYLLFNEDVVRAIEGGAFASGAAHYGAYGRSEDRIVNRFCAAPNGCAFNEAEYLALNPDVAHAVRAGAFRSGAGHYGAYGRRENRQVGFSCGGGQPDQPQDRCAFNESDYLAFNPDVASAIQGGAFYSGYDHYARYGRNENRLVNRRCVGQRCAFVERDYLEFNQDVVRAISGGAFQSGAHHFGSYGRNENRIINRSCI